MKRQGIALPLIGLLLALGAVAFGWYNMNKMPDARFPVKPDFSLVSADGPLSLKELRGKVVLAFFGYAHCPDVCPNTLIRMKSVLDELSEDEREKVRFLFITLDPARDTPEIMKEYVNFFDPRIIGLSGDFKAVGRAADSFKVPFDYDAPNKVGNYDVNHGTYFFVIRPDGELGHLVGHQDPIEDILAALRYWMKWAD